MKKNMGTPISPKFKENMYEIWLYHTEFSTFMIPLVVVYACNITTNTVVGNLKNEMIFDISLFIIILSN